jgi:redox-sensitive bicupin YhaK (pirin superfamily)
MEGLIDHTDSLGNGGRYGQGDLQWMTAGKGVVHGEMFPLVKTDANNSNRFFQLWLNLPSQDKMVDPDFKMHWAPEIPKVQSDDGKTEITVWAGNYGKKQALPPPPNSWAAKLSSEVAIWRIRIQPGGTIALPPAAGGTSISRCLYFYEGDRIRVADKTFKQPTQITVRADAEVSLAAEGSQEVEVLMLQGKPIGEPVAQGGPFVMNTAKEIRQAYADYQTTRFGGWPWPEDAMVFPREKGRFAKLRGVETFPPEAKK